VYAKFPSTCLAQTLKLVLRGHELSEFDYQYVLQQDQENFVTKLGRRRARKDILKREIKLAENACKWYLNWLICFDHSSCGELFQNLD